MEFASGNIYIREMRFEKAGDSTNGHDHYFDHTTYVVRGAIRVERLRKVKDEATVVGGDGRTQVIPAQYEVERVVEKRAIDGRNWLLIKAGVCHRITALEPNTLAHCIYSHRNPQGEVVEEFDGWPKAYF